MKILIFSGNLIVLLTLALIYLLIFVQSQLDSAFKAVN